MNSTRSIDMLPGEHRTTSSKAYTSGFFAGNLWYLYQLMGNESYRQKAVSWTELLELEKVNNSDHHIGLISISHGKGLPKTGFWIAAPFFL